MLSQPLGLIWSSKRPLQPLASRWLWSARALWAGALALVGAGAAAGPALAAKSVCIAIGRVCAATSVGVVSAARPAIGRSFAGARRGSAICSSSSARGTACECRQGAQHNDVFFHNHACVVFSFPNRLSFYVKGTIDAFRIGTTGGKTCFRIQETPAREKRSRPAKLAI